MANNVQLLNEAIEELQLLGQNELAMEIIEAHVDGNLLTYAEWKKKGYQVQKGQKAKFSCKLWKKKTKAELEKEKKKLEDEAKAKGEKPKKPSQFVMTKCSFFLPSQVENIKNEVA